MWGNSALVWFPWFWIFLHLKFSGFTASTQYGLRVSCYIFSRNQKKINDSATLAQNVPSRSMCDVHSTKVFWQSCTNFHSRSILVFVLKVSQSTKALIFFCIICLFHCHAPWTYLFIVTHHSQLRARNKCLICLSYAGTRVRVMLLLTDLAMRVADSRRITEKTIISRSS